MVGDISSVRSQVCCRGAADRQCTLYAYVAAGGGPKCLYTAIAQREMTIVLSRRLPEQYHYTQLCLSHRVF